MKHIIPFISIVLSLMLISIEPVIAGTIGDKFPIAVEAPSESARSAAFDGTNYLVGIQGDAVSRHNVTAQLIDQSGSRIGPRISTGRTGGAPSVAFDGTNYLMVWGDDANHGNNYIYGRFISPEGTLVGAAFAISPAGGYQEPYGLVFDGLNYFVVWCIALVNNGCNDEYGQFVTPSGDLLGSPIKINQTDSGGGAGTLAFDLTRILVVSLSEWSSSGTKNGCTADGCEAVNVVGQFITKSGAVTPGAPSGNNFWISESPGSKGPPSASFDGTNYLVAFSEGRRLCGVYGFAFDLCGKNGCDFDVSAYLVTKTGVLSSSKITVTNAPARPSYSMVYPVGANYLVGWVDCRNDANNDEICDGNEGTCVDTYGQFINQSGALQGSEIVISNEAGNDIGILTFGGKNVLLIINELSGGGEPEPFGDVYGQLMCISGIDGDGDGIDDACDNCILVPSPDQCDSNADGYGNACDADLNNDDVVNFADLALMKKVFFKPDPDADLNCDGVVNFADLAIMKKSFFKAPGPSGLSCAGHVPCEASTP